MFFFSCASISEQPYRNQKCGTPQGRESSVRAQADGRPTSFPNLGVRRAVRGVRLVASVAVCCVCVCVCVVGSSGVSIDAGAVRIEQNKNWAEKEEAGRQTRNMKQPGRYVRLTEQTYPNMAAKKPPLRVFLLKKKIIHIWGAY